MYCQKYVDYDHKSIPSSNLFDPQHHQSSSETIRTDNEMTVQSKQRLSRNCFPDFFVKEFICDQIIQSISFNNDFIFFCFHCNNYIQDLEKVRQHVVSDHHIKMKTIKKYNKGLNKKFVIKSMNSEDLEYLSEIEIEEMIHQELDRIPNDQKHFYMRRGIRLMNVIGDYAFYCNICEKPISSFALIETHLGSESHNILENRTELFGLITNGKHRTPIVGLQFIIEYKNNSMKELVYKCSFCQIYKNADQMYSHLFDFKHQINVLNNLENSCFESISEQQLNLKLNEWHQKLGMGTVTKTKETPNINGNNSSSSMEQLRAIFGSFRPKSCDSIERLFAVRVLNDSDAQKVIQIIEAIKDSAIEYYSRKNRHNFNNNH